MIGDAHMVRHIALTVFAAAALACAGTVSFAQDPPPKGGPTQSPPPPAAGPVQAVGRTPTPSRYLVKPGKLCFWRGAAGGPFGASGTCWAAPSAPVGSSCSCGVNGSPRAGNVISAPSPGPTPVVR